MPSMTSTWILLLVGAAAVLLTACGGVPMAPSTATPGPARPTATLAAATATPTAAAPTPAPLPDPVAEAAVKAARADLAHKLNISENQIGLKKIEAVQWRDSSLGCPKSGQGYLQVITPGFRIWLEAQGQTYEYHSDTRGNVVSCGEGQEPLPTDTPAGSGGGGSDNPMVDLAKADLAKRLGIPPAQIALVKVENIDWPDSCLGIHQPGVACLDVMVPGFLILLSAQNKTYEYHTDQTSRALLTTD